VCKALGWVGVGVKPIRVCLCLWSQRPSLLWCSPAGVVQCTVGAKAWGETAIWLLVPFCVPA